MAFACEVLKDMRDMVSVETVAMSRWRPSRPGRISAIHHYGESWQPWDHRLEMKIWRLFRVKRHPLVTWHIRHWLRLIGINF